MDGLISLLMVGYVGEWMGRWMGLMGGWIYR